MRRSIIGLAVLALVGTGAYTVLAEIVHCSKTRGLSAQITTASVASTCSPAKGTTAAATRESPRGKIVGNFDPLMSGACRFACATKFKYEPKSVLAQPGAVAGKLTQCPVSGVVFTVDASRPHVEIAGDEYVACCDKCAQKLKKDPRHYLKV